MRGSIPWESFNELAFLHLAELDHSVTHIFAQPIHLELQTPSGQRRHTPDFAVLRGGRVEIHEVKPDEKASQPDTQELSSAATLYVRKHGANYGMALASVLRAEPRYGRARSIIRRLHDTLPDCAARALLAHVEANPGSTIERTLCATSWMNTTFEMVITMIAHNRLSAQLTEPLSKKTPLASRSSDWPEGALLASIPELGGVGGSA